MDKGAKDKLAGSPGENGGGQDAQKDLHSRTGRDETNRKTQERMERRSGKRSSSAGSEKMERGADRQGQMERYCSTGQSPQRAVAPTEEEEEIWAVSKMLRVLAEKVSNSDPRPVILTGILRYFPQPMRT